MNVEWCKIKLKFDHDKKKSIFKTQQMLTFQTLPEKLSIKGIYLSISICMCKCYK